MSIFTYILAVLVLQMGLAKCFSWDIVVVDGGKRLQFYKNGTLTHTEDIPSAKEISSITHDPVHHRVLFADVTNYPNQQISSFDLSTRNIQPLFTSSSSNYLIKFAYDPVTQLMFWRKDEYSIYSYSLNPASSNKAVDGNHILTLHHHCSDIAVDSCGGYIYWITDYEIERARFDGSEREVVLYSCDKHNCINVFLRSSFTIDQHTQKMYWIEKLSDDDQINIDCADLNGKNRRTLYTAKNEAYTGSLTVSDGFIYWNSIKQKAIWELPKTGDLVPKLFSTSNNGNWYNKIIAKSIIKEQLIGNQNCETLKSLIPNESEPDSIDVMLCVHGTKVSGESRCECTQGYTGEKCDTFVCQNYCLQGNCSVNAEGEPKCSCKAGYSGERCAVPAV